MYFQFKISTTSSWLRRRENKGWREKKGGKEYIGGKLLTSSLTEADGKLEAGTVSFFWRDHLFDGIVEFSP